MKDKEVIARLCKFCDFYKDEGYEKGQSQPFWLSLLSCFGIENPNEMISFEDQVMLDHTSFIDGYIPATHVLIEQKGKDKDLDKAMKQSDGSMLTPFQQAKRYSAELPYSDRPRWIVTCNFKEFRIYDMQTPHAEPGKIKLEDLPKEYYRLNFLVDEKNDRIKKEVEVSVKAGEIVGKLYNALLKQYYDPEDPETLKSINILCVRLVFCMYSEDAGIFGRHGMFTEFLKKYDAEDIREQIIKLFEVLNTPEDKRDRYLKATLAEFPYVNGGLFAKEDIEIPAFNDEIIDLLVNDAGEEFDWRNISPTVFGACFESTLNPQTRRSGGMHYTSIENIHKVIDPLFLNDLERELNEIMEIQAIATKKRRLDAFQTKLAGLDFLDPACGSGNFLTETYLCLRRMENTVIAEKIALEKGQAAGQIRIGEGILNPIKVSIGQFSGIEINDFAVAVAKTALWIAESQMMQETEKIVHFDIDFLPLKTDANIVEGNALTMDWNEVCDRNELNYIMGNPPFNGTRTMNKEQKQDVLNVFGKNWKSYNSLDYVSCWYKKAAEMMLGREIYCGFVSTNSIVQGEQVPALWKPLFEDYGLQICYAHKTFVWNNESRDQAKVHCIIAGFTIKDVVVDKKYLFSSDGTQVVKNINAYLNDAPNIFVERQNKPICNVPEIYLGCTFNDNNHLIMTKEEKDEFVLKNPFLAKYIRPYVMGKDFIDRKPRYCFWLKDADPEELKRSQDLIERIKNVQEFRKTCKNSNTFQTAETPMLPSMMRYYNRDENVPFVAIPKVSSQRRKYIPMEMLSSDYIAGDKIFLMPNADKYSFGILTSNMHMAWMRMFCGRLKSDYSYSSTIVYNTLPWPSPTVEQKAKIEQTAQGILDARANHPNASLATLYDPLTMPDDLLKAHQDNDRAVMQAYGIPVKGTSESDCVAHLMKMYQELTKE